MWELDFFFLGGGGRGKEKWRVGGLEGWRGRIVWMFGGESVVMSQGLGRDVMGQFGGGGVGSGNGIGGGGMGDGSVGVMRKLYDAQVVKPFAYSKARPSRLGYQTVAWCEGLDLIAVVSGCGGVAVFHADAPGENVPLVSYKKAAARHVAWRPLRKDDSMKKDDPLLLVADAVGRLTFWAAKVRTSLDRLGIYPRREFSFCLFSFRFSAD